MVPCVCRKWSIPFSLVEARTEISKFYFGRIMYIAWDYVYNPTIVGFSFSSPTSPWLEVFPTDTFSILHVYLACTDVNTLLQRGCPVGQMCPKIPHFCA
jgi:hypothetical protein